MKFEVDFEKEHHSQHPIHCQYYNFRSFKCKKMCLAQTSKTIIMRHLSNKNRDIRQALQPTKLTVQKVKVNK